jgi:DNA polymerase-3 subunit beta
MEFKINKELFLSNLQSVLGIIPARTTYPILQNVLLEVEADRIFLSATDLDTYIQKELSASEYVAISKTGKIIMPGRRLFEIIREAPEDTIAFTSTENNILITSGRSRFTMPGLDPQEYPEAPQLPTETTFKIPMVTLLDGYDNTAFAVSRDESRPAMCGICLEIRNGELQMVATDGHRLALIKKSGDAAPYLGGLNIKSILSTKVLGLLSAKEFDGKGGSEVFEVSLDSSKVGFVFKNNKIISRLIEGPYPDYERVIPTGNPNILSVDREVLASALRRVSLFAHPMTKAVKFSLEPKRIVLYAATPETGEATDSIDCSYQGEQLEIGYNAAYLIEVLKHIETAAVSFELSTALSAGLIRPDAQAGTSSKQFLLMPVRLD